MSDDDADDSPPPAVTATAPDVPTSDNGAPTQPDSGSSDGQAVPQQTAEPAPNKAQINTDLRNDGLVLQPMPAAVDTDEADPATVKLNPKTAHSDEQPATDAPAAGSARSAAGSGQRHIDVAYSVEPSTRSQSSSSNIVASATSQIVSSDQAQQAGGSRSDRRDARQQAPNPAPVPLSDEKPIKTSGQGPTVVIEPMDVNEPNAAAARARQVNDTVRLTNLARSAGESDVTSRPVLAPPSAQPTLDLQGRASDLRAFLQGDPGASGDPQRGSVEARATDSVWRGLSAMINQRGGVMHMRLDPPQLGELRIHMTISQGTVNATFQASTAAAHSILEQHMQTLRTALENHGLSVDRLSVSSAAPLSSHNSGSAQSDTSDQQQQGLKQHDDAANGESRGRSDDTPDHQGRERGSAWSGGTVDTDIFRDLAAHIAAGAIP